jgi:stage V sporulation protein AA
VFFDFLNNPAISGKDYHIQHCGGKEIGVMGKAVYLVLEKSVKLTGSKEDKKINVKLSDVCTVGCSDKQILNKLSHISVCVLDVEGKKHVRQLVKLTDLTDLVEAACPEADITPVGENQVMLDYEVSNEKPVIQALLTVFMCVFAFIGSMYVIMAYNNDVGTIEIFERVYKLLDISDLSGMNIIEIAYGVGLALGIIVFYNHFGKLRVSDTPSPIQVEMVKYESDEEDALVSKLSGNMWMKK